MKVVLFCGGFGMRLRDDSESTPKPLMQIGYRPILWHVMKYYAHYGHKDFILCLGWRADAFKEYFLNYNECLSNDFILNGNGRVNLLNSDIQDWNITFVDTGTTSNVGQRLLAVREHLRGEEHFLANYTDGLSDLYLPGLIDFHREQQAVATLLSILPKYNSFHAVKIDEQSRVSEIEPVENLDIWMNGGFFVFTQDIFNYLQKGEELVEQPLQRLIKKRKLATLRHHGFWACMDTFKEKEMLENMVAHGDAPWEVWKTHDCSNSGKINGTSTNGNTVKGTDVKTKTK